MRALTSLRYIDAIARAGSIRQAAETLAITPSALNRRLIAIEDELQTQIFERLPRGVRLNAVGEILIHHIRLQISDFERVKSQIADLSGERRGHVSIACSQALLPIFLPEQVESYREAHPAVTFGIHPRDRVQAEAAISDFTADLALVFEPVRMVDFHPMIVVRQAIRAVMSRQHPLAKEPLLRLRDCLHYPLALPSPPYGVRAIFDTAVARLDRRAAPTVESDHFEFLRRATAGSNLISFQIEIGLPADEPDSNIISRGIDSRDIPDGSLHLGYLRGRVIPVAAARFAAQVAQNLAARFKVV